MPEVPVQTKVPQVKQTTSSFNWKKVLIVVLLGAALIAIVVGVYYFLYGFEPVSTTNNQIEIKSATPSTKPATSSAQKDETAGWETYTSSAVGFSIKYPRGWYVKETPSNPNSPLTYVFISEKPISGATTWYALTVTADSGGYIEKEYDNTEKLEINKPISSVIDSGSHVVERLPNIKVDNLVGLVYTEKPGDETSTVPYNETVYVKNGSKAYKIFRTAESQADFDNYQEKFDLMLLTFKFL